MPRPPDVPTSIAGRRGYWRYLYGTHGWIPVVEAHFDRGMIRDAARVTIPNGGIYDAADFLLNKPGVAQKRGGTSYAGPALTAATYAANVFYAPFSTPQIVSVGDNGHLYKVTSGATTDVATLGAGWPGRHRPILVTSAGTKLVVLPNSDGTTAPKRYNGAAVATLGGTPPAGITGAVYKSRLVLGNVANNANRLYFSQIPDVEATWDTANSYIDCDNDISGLAALHNALIIFSRDHTEAIVGSTPPPNSDMDRKPIGSIGCTDARSIVVQEGQAIFSNPRGVYLTNGASFASLTTEGHIESYWQSLFSGYDPATWVISAGILRSYLFVTVLNAAGTLVTSLMCNVPKRAWWRNTNMAAAMYASAADANDELYYADRSTNRVVQMSGIFAPAASNKNDANGTAVAPSIEFRAIGDSTSVKSFGFGRVTYTMTDAASDNPTMAVTVKTGVDADTSSTPTGSPLPETTIKSRARFTIGKNAQAVTIALAQTGASAVTEINALEVEQRSHPLSQEGVG